jgi:hypothetical protein
MALDAQAVATDVAQRKPSLQALRILDRASKKEMLKFLIAKYKLEFTYIRNTDNSCIPYRHGGAVVCWQMPSKPGARMIPLSIAWCHDNEVFDKMQGRYYAAMKFTEGKRVVFKLPPGTEGISIRIREVFSNGFLV